MTERAFGRRHEFDYRSRQWPIRALLGDQPDLKPLRSYTWRCSKHLDQLDSSACVGFSFAHELIARPAEISRVDDTYARMIYARAQQIDQWPGEDYEGTSVIAGAKVLRELGWVSEYRWAFGFRDLALTLGYRGPVVLGLNWHEGMLTPGPYGIIRPTGPVVGGHAILATGINVRQRLVRLHNSWGPGWGISGDCFIDFDDLERLLHSGGEACIPVVRRPEPRGVP